MAKDGETVYEYNERVGLTGTRQDILDKIVGRAIEPDWWYYEDIKKKLEKVVRKKVDEGIL